MEKVERLVNILKKLNQGENTAEVRKDALELVKNIDPLELSMAEQKLIESGLHPEDLRSLCDIHMEVLKDELERLRAQVKPSHVLNTLILEHDEILKLLTLLDNLNAEIQKMDVYDEKSNKFKELFDLAESIISAENHHQREEKVLFIEMENRNITGPTRIMRMEHDDLRVKKHLIRELALNVSNMNFNEFKLQLDAAAKYVVFNLRDHIFKENHILYPTAINSIDSNEVWDKMKEDCDKIGYCPFTPHI